MFFQHKIKSIKPNDRVLEIGPGSTPFPRANAFLEFQFLSELEAIQQRGGALTKPNYQDRPISYYQGGRFPFDDGQFDYVLASHVIEHVSDPVSFMSEIYRVGGGRGYVEFPLPPYDYLFNFDVHTQFVWFDEQDHTIQFLKKENTGLNQFDHITSQLRVALELGWDDLVASNLNCFFKGIEFDSAVPVIEQKDLSGYAGTWHRDGHTLARKLGRKLTDLIERAE